MLIELRKSTSDDAVVHLPYKGNLLEVPGGRCDQFRSAVRAHITRRDPVTAATHWGGGGILNPAVVNLKERAVLGAAIPQVSR